MPRTATGKCAISLGPAEPGVQPRAANWERLAAENPRKYRPAYKSSKPIAADNRAASTRGRLLAEQQRILDAALRGEE